MFHSYLVPDQWDTWAWYNEQNNKYYAYYLVRSAPNYKGEGFGLAISTDTVHWTDYGQIWSNPIAHNESHEGTGTVWLNPEYNNQDTSNSSFEYIVNFSTEPIGESYQNISFAVSSDLIHWKSQINNIGWFDINTTYYKYPGRWDTIYLFKGINNKQLFGAWTATPYNPKNETKYIWGYGQTQDGLHWTALPSPEIIWNGVTPPNTNGELGAIERFIMNNGSILYFSMVGMNGKMYGFYANKPDGPYYPNYKNFEILSGDCYYSRFFRINDVILITHQSMSNQQAYNRPVTYIAPYKYADIDDEGVFRMKYWIGNDNMKDKELSINSTVYVNGSNETLMDLSFVEPITGLLMEGTMDFSVDDSVGLQLGMINDKFACINITKDGIVGMNLSMNGKEFECDVGDNGEKIDRGIILPIISSFRLLLRMSMFELYINDILYVVNKLNVNQSGIIGMVKNSKQFVKFIDIFSMGLYVNKTTVV